jgi:hypothetical protein
MLSNLACWDVIYEHFSYFEATALANLFRDTTVESQGTGFGGQFLWLEGVGRGESASPLIPPDPELLRQFESFGEAMSAQVAEWAGRLTQLAAAGPVVLWGAGSKGVTFLNLLAAHSSVTHVVDINPRKWGKYVPVTGHEVTGPEAIRGLRSATVLVMNEAYLHEIRCQLNELGCDATVVAVADSGVARMPGPAPKRPAKTPSR